MPTAFAECLYFEFDKNSPWSMGSSRNQPSHMALNLEKLLAAVFYLELNYNEMTECTSKFA